MNSAHQLWSLWVTTVTVPFHPRHVSQHFTADMRAATSRWYRQAFGSASELKIDSATDTTSSRFTIACRTEGAAAPDSVFRQQRMAQIAEFFGASLRHYGAVRVRVDVKVEAGDVGDGKPPAQLILGPSVALMPHGHLFGL